MTTAVKHDAGKPGFTLIPWATLEALDPGGSSEPLTHLERWWRREAPEIGTLKLAANAAIASHRLHFDQADLTDGWRIADFIRPVLEFGATKYAAWNWTKGFVWSRPYNAAIRHLRGYVDGEGRFQGGILSGARDDPETGLYHVGHFLCCIVFLAHYQAWGVGEDDRPESAT